MVRRVGRCRRHLGHESPREGRTRERVWALSIRERDQEPSGHEAQLDQCREPPHLTGTQVPAALQLRGDRARGEPDGHSEENRQRDEGESAPAAGISVGVAIGVSVGVQENTNFFPTNHRFAGLSAKRLIYHGNQAVP
jgi:hypothetical protein